MEAGGKKFLKWLIFSFIQEAFIINMKQMQYI